jgi:hypothetical protein
LAAGKFTPGSSKAVAALHSIGTNNKSAVSAAFDSCLFIEKISFE